MKDECNGCIYRVIINLKDIYGRGFQMYECECETKMCASCIPTYKEE